MKTREEINTLRKQVEELNQKLAELNEEELQEVVGGFHNMPKINPDERYVMNNNILGGPTSSE